MWRWRRMDTIRWSDNARNEELGVLHRVREERKILQSTKRRKADWIGRI